MLKDIYTAIGAQVKNEGTAIKCFDWYNRQYDNMPAQKENEQLIFAMPAVFIEFEPILDFEKVRPGIQAATVKFKLHIVTQTYSDPRMGSAGQSKAMEHFETEDAVYALMEGFNASKTVVNDPPNNTDGTYQIINSVTRTGLYTDHNKTNVIATVQEYTAYCFDYAAQKVRVKPGNGTIKLSVENVEG